MSDTRSRPSRLGRVVPRMHRMYAAIGHRAAGEASSTCPSGMIDNLRRRRYCIVVTYRRNGAAVPTPVWFGVHAGRVYFRAEGCSGKAKRLRVTTAVRIAPCTRRGRPLGPPFEGVARIVTGEEAAAAERIIQSNYWLGRRMYERWLTLPDGIYVEVTPT